VGLAAHAQNVVRYLLINAGNINANGMLKTKKSTVSAFVGIDERTTPA